MGRFIPLAPGVRPPITESLNRYLDTPDHLALHKANPCQNQFVYKQIELITQQQHHITGACIHWLIA